MLISCFLNPCFPLVPPTWLHFNKPSFNLLLLLFQPYPSLFSYPSYTTASLSPSLNSHNKAVPITNSLRPGLLLISPPNSVFFYACSAILQQTPDLRTQSRRPAYNRNPPANPWTPPPNQQSTHLRNHSCITSITDPSTTTVNTLQYRVMGQSIESFLPTVLFQQQQVKTEFVAVSPS